MNDTPNTNRDHAADPSEGDALLTAYALGELDPQSEDYKAIAARVADVPALQEQVQQIAALGSQLTQSYEQAAGPGLDDDALAGLADATDTPTTRTAPIARIHRKPSLTRRLLPYAGVAACTALATAGVFMVIQQQEADQIIAMDQQPVINEAYVFPNTRVVEDRPEAVADSSGAPVVALPVLPNTTPAFGGVAVEKKLDRYYKTIDGATLSAPKLSGTNGVQYGFDFSGRSREDTNARLQKPGFVDGRLASDRLSGFDMEEIDAVRFKERRIAGNTEKRKIKEIQTHLRSARQHQLNKDYDKAIADLDAALFLEPDNKVLLAFREMVQDNALAVEAFDLKRHRDLDIEKQAIELANAIERRIIEVERREEIRILERERRERFAELTDNPFKLAEHEPLSTFSVDVDTASYAYGRRAILTDKTLPTPDSIRIEEWINYFDYAYTAPVVDPDKIPNGRLTTAALEKLEAADESFVPFATEVEVVQCPWTEGNQLVRIGIQAMEVAQTDRPPAHLVFLLDVSGSMNRGDKLGLVQQGMPMLLDQLNDNDKVSIVVYAGASGLVLEAAEAADKNKIKEAIANLRAGGSTAGGAGIKLAYDIADKHFVGGGVNRVILCTDGDFNVGTSDTKSLVDLVKSKANPQDDGDNKGVYLSVMGFGTGNLNDEMMEKITNAGNGNYHYIDSVNEAVKTMSKQAGGTLVTVAKDVKLQLEFNPAKVASYRLIGYENRVLRNEDFNNDTVDAGDIGAGHSVTALYEIVPIKDAPADDDAAPDKEPVIDELRYQKPRGLAEAAELPELLTLKLRYKPVDAKAEQGTSRKVVKHVPANAVTFDKASEATRFTSSVAALGMILRGSPHKGQATSHWVVETAQGAKAHDPNGYRHEFIQLATQVGLLEAERDNAFRKDLVE